MAKVFWKEDVMFALCKKILINEIDRIAVLSIAKNHNIMKNQV